MKLYIDLNKAVSQTPNTGVDTPLEDQSVEEYKTSFARRPVGVAAGEENDPDDPKVGKRWNRASDTEVSERKARQKKRTADAAAEGLIKPPIKKAQPFDGGFTREEAERAADSLKVDFSEEKFGLSEFVAGINVEREHADVSKDASTLGKITLAHLRETPDYYKKLKQVEKSVDILKSINNKLATEKARRMPNIREQEFLMDVLGYSQEDITKGVAVITGRNRRLFNRWLCDRLANSTSDLLKSVGADIG